MNRTKAGARLARVSRQTASGMGFAKNARAALADNRDVLYWAEYQTTDPMFHDQDPKKRVDELAKWGRKD